MTYLGDLVAKINEELPKDPLYKNKEFQERYLEYLKFKIE